VKPPLKHVSMTMTNASGSLFLCETTRWLKKNSQLFTYTYLLTGYQHWSLVVWIESGLAV